jgi:two-component system sensor histidine kinase HydH
VPRITAQDAVLIFLFSAIATLSPTRDVWEIGMIATLAALQFAESRLPWVETLPGKVTWILLKLSVAYLLIGYTGGVASSYYLMLLLPIVTAATSLDVLPTLLFSLIACGAYLSFLLFIDWNRFQIEPDQVRAIALRLLFLAVAGNLVNALAGALRIQNARYRAVAEQLAEANLHLSEAEAAMRRSERLAALGQLSAGLAHEIRNPLGTIKASAEMLTRYVPADNPLAQEMAGFISTEVDRTNSLVTRFLDFAKPLAPQREPADLSQIIDRAIAAVERDNTQVTLYRNYSPDLPKLPLDPNLMQQVFYNLILNAAQASPQGGSVTIKTKSLPEGAEVSIIDRGTGIAPANLETIFNPFFTTKPTGVGLGLPIVQKIIDEHGGRLTVHSEEGQGSTFRVYLPSQ